MSRSRASCLSAVTLAAGCLREPLDDPQDTASTTGSSGTTVAPTSDDTAPTTGTIPSCGDGVIADDEQCDDGNATPDDGCHDCHPAGTLLWTRTHAGPEQTPEQWIGVAIAPNGDVVLAGSQDVGGLGSARLLGAYTAAGELLWIRVLEDPGESTNSLYRVAVGPDGTIYATGATDASGVESTGVLHAFTPDGVPTWSFIDPPIDGRGRILIDVEFAEGALVSTGNERGQDDNSALLRRHDPATGEPLWTSVLPLSSPTPSPNGVAVSGGLVAVVGDDVFGSSQFIAVYDLDGELQWMSDNDLDSDLWYDVDGIGDGDFVVVGTTPTLDTGWYGLIRRFGPAGELRWQHTSEPTPFVQLNAVAVGPGEEIVVAAGNSGGNISLSLTLRYTGAGDLLWTSELPGAWAWGAAAGAGLAVVAGIQYSPEDAHVRAFAFP